MAVSNSFTPRIFVAATHQDAGKTTTSLGLLAALKKRYEKIGYIKPIGQRYIEVPEGKIDEDAFLVSDAYQVELPLDAMSPIAVDSGFTRWYLDHGNREEMEKRLGKAFDRACWEKDFVVIEGSGHAGVGSVFEMSNARAAKILGSKAIIVSQGGVGKPIDEINLNLALFQREGVEVIGAILNKVHGDKIESLYPFAEKGLAKLGLPLLGMIPYKPELPKATIGQVCDKLDGDLIAGENLRRRRIHKVSIVTASSENLGIYIEPGSLLLTAGDREDLIWSIIKGFDVSSKESIAGVVLTQGIVPHPGLVKIMQDKGIPFISCKFDSFTAATKIINMTVKTEPGDNDKIGIINDMIEKHVDVDRIISIAMED